MILGSPNSRNLDTRQLLSWHRVWPEVGTTTWLSIWHVTWAVADGDPSVDENLGTTKQLGSWWRWRKRSSKVASLRVGTCDGQVALWMQQETQCVYFEAALRVKLDADLRDNAAYSRGCERKSVVICDWRVALFAETRPFFQFRKDRASSQILTSPEEWTLHDIYIFICLYYMTLPSQSKGRV